MNASPGRQAGWASETTARFYDRQLWLERRALTMAVELAAPRVDDVTVDLATGTGAVLRALAEHPTRPRTALGLDASAAMLEAATGLPDDWQLRAADVRHLPLPSASVDLITCCYLLHLLDAGDRGAVLGEIARVLRPGGRTVVVTLLEPRGLLGGGLLAPLQRALAAALGPSSGWRAWDPSPEFAAAGLVVMRRRVCTRGYASLCLLAERA